MPSLKMMLLSRLAQRRGFKPVAGGWVKEWPSGKTWAFNYDGSNPRILDEFGRIIRNKDDGISTYGLLFNSDK